VLLSGEALFLSGRDDLAYWASVFGTGDEPGD
jgi:hypothetical protein